MINYENLARKTLTSSSLTPKGSSNIANGRSLLPIKLGITDECQHVNHEIKVTHELTDVSDDFSLQLFLSFLALSLRAQQNEIRTRH